MGANVPGSTIWEMYAMPEAILPNNYLSVIYMEASGCMFKKHTRRKIQIDTSVQANNNNNKKLEHERAASVVSSLGQQYDLKQKRGDLRGHQLQDNPIVGKKLASHLLYIYSTYCKSE